jgi:hypothetical protein
MDDDTNDDAVAAVATDGEDGAYSDAYIDVYGVLFRCRIRFVVAIGGFAGAFFCFAGAFFFAS